MRADDAQDWPVRDQESATCTGATETAAEFSGRIYTEPYRRGWSRAQKKVVATKLRWVMARQHLLDNGQIEQLVAKLRALPGDDPQADRIHPEGGELL